MRKENKMKILAIGKQPGEVEQLVGGSVAKYVEGGSNVIICSVTNGSKNKDESTRLKRMAEGSRAANFLGAKYTTLDIDLDELDENDTTQVDKLYTLINSIGVDIIISPPMTEANSVNNLLFRALDKVSNKEIKLYHADRFDGIESGVDLFIDISDYLEKKIESLTIHISQVEILRKSKQMNILHNVEVVASYRGLRIGTRFAEGFKASDTYGQKSSNLLT